MGRHVFSAFNKVEVLLAAFDLLGWYLLVQRGLVPGGTFVTDATGRTTPFSGFRQLDWRQWLRFAPGLIVYVFESFALLPALRSRSARVIEGRPVESARVHTLYVALEVFKAVTLTASTITIGRALLR